jgi:beta-galactosidase GanA
MGRRIPAMLLALACACADAAEAPIPALRTSGGERPTQQLIVDGQPYLLLGGELYNSSASSLPYLQKLWPRLKATGLNTLLVPVEWDQLEPVEGRFDFTLLDGLLRQARANDTRLVLLWFGAWKNSMSTYVPPWVKRDDARFPRARDKAGAPQDILTPFAAATLAADQAAFAALLRHLRQVDAQRTVLMVQVENEIGMLPDARDHGPLADAALGQPVPTALLRYLHAHRATLHPHVRSLWEGHGARQAGTWGEVFGASVEAEEVFQAWHYATFANALAAAGKAEYPLPMFVNVALNRPGRKPGEYPSAGPLPHLFDVWKAAGPAIDILAIDSYFPNFTHWARQFKRPDNPLFVPEANRAGRADLGANAFWAIGELDAIGFSPFAIENIRDAGSDVLPGAYALLRQLAPHILAAQGQGRMRGFRPDVSYDGVVDMGNAQATLGGYLLDVSFANQWGKTDSADVDTRGGLVIQTAADEFLVAGRGITVTFRSPLGPVEGVGILQATEGAFVDGRWQPGRWLNGDETHQGRHIRLPGDAFTVQKVRLYRFR